LFLEPGLSGAKATGGEDYSIPLVAKEGTWGKSEAGAIGTGLGNSEGAKSEIRKKSEGRRPKFTTKEGGN
jgi:hypothetical protein